jgi:hypothetical protein
VVEELTAGHPEEIEDSLVAAGCMVAVEDDEDRTQGSDFSTILSSTVGNC